jgi:hypothetical protein
MVLADSDQQRKRNDKTQGINMSRASRPSGSLVPFDRARIKRVVCSSIATSAKLTLTDSGCSAGGGALR